MSIPTMSEVAPEAVLSLAEMCRILGRSRWALSRAVERGELPPPVRFLGRRAWVAGAVVRHLQQRQDEAMRQQATMARRVVAMQP